jgi:hypothetical protein
MSEKKESLKDLLLLLLLTIIKIIFIILPINNSGNEIQAGGNSNQNNNSGNANQVGQNSNQNDNSGDANQAGGSSVKNDNSNIIGNILFLTKNGETIKHVQLVCSESNLSIMYYDTKTDISIKFNKDNIELKPIHIKKILNCLKNEKNHILVAVFTNNTNYLLSYPST